MPRNCATENCERHPRSESFRWCDECTAIVLRTGRPPVLPVKFVPRWLANLPGPRRDGTDRRMTTGVINGLSTIDAVRAAMPERYWLQIHIGKDWGYVRIEPPSRPGNRGPRLPRFTASFGGNSDPAQSLDSALLDVLGELQAEAA